MTSHQPRNPGIEEKIQATADHVRRGTCPRCHAPVLRARAGRVAALDVTADPTPVDAIGEIHARLAGRLAWHLVTNSLGQQRITWRGPEDIHAGPEPNRLVIADHACPPQPVQETLL
jgi:hypothetical protein